MTNLRTNSAVLVTMTLLILLSSMAAQRGSKKLPLSVVISTEQAELNSGSPVRIKITLTNISDSTIGLEQLDVSPNITIVRGADGLLTSETRHGSDLKQKQRERSNPNMIGGPRVGVQLEAGKTLVEECVVSDLYDMMRPGQYSIQVERIWSRREAVLSNTINVRIIP